MDIKKLAQILLTAGLIGIALALLWWASFYGPIMKDLGGHLSSASSCIYSNSGGCAIASGFANLIGKTPYNPILFWAGVVSWGVGMLLKATIKEQGQPPQEK